MKKIEFLKKSGLGLLAGWSFLAAVLVTGVIALSCLNPIGYNPSADGKTIVSGEIDVSIRERDPALFEGDLSNIDDPKKTLPTDLTQGLGILIVKNITKNASAHVWLDSADGRDKHYQMPGGDAASVSGGRRGTVHRAVSCRMGY